MIETNEAMFRLLKESLFAADPSSDLWEQGCDWADVYQEMQDHTIDALPYKLLLKHSISDEDLQEQWINSCIRSQSRWARVMYAQQQLIELLEENSIPCVIIKGAAAAMAYPSPTLRTVGDVDFLVKRTDFDKAAEVLESNGFQIKREKDSRFHHFGYEKSGVSFEMHSRLGIVLETNEALIALFERGIDHRVWQQIEERVFPTLPVDLNGLVLLFHINQHLRSGLGFRQIIDWMMYLYKNNNLESLLPKIREAGMEKLALTVTAMCQRYLGLEEMVENAEAYPVEALMEYIGQKGNFGRKNGIAGKTEYVFLDMSNPVRVFRKLQIGGLKRWNAAKEHTWLRPFAWIYQIGRITKELVCNKVTPIKMLRLRKAGKQQRALIRQLGLDVDKYI